MAGRKLDQQNNLSMRIILEEILKERERQIAKGWTLEHDDVHTQGELFDAGMSYLYASIHPLDHPMRQNPSRWPFEKESWKPSTDPIRNMVKGLTLLVAEAERLDRLKETTKLLSDRELRRQELFELAQTNPEALVTQVLNWEDQLSSVMPKDLKDWWKNSRDEWPLVAKLVIESLRDREEEAWMEAKVASERQD
jgi:hypothetical protein